LPMLGLSWSFAGADESRRTVLAAAGEALLAKGAHGSPGVLTGFLLSSIANIAMSGEMLRTHVFSRVTGMLGLAGNILLGLYLVLVTFVPQVQDVAMAFAAPGGLLTIGWILLLAARLFKLSHT